MIGGGISRHPALAKPEDILKRDNRGIHHHTDSKGKTGEGNHIDRQAQPGNRHKGADDRYRNGSEDNHGRQNAAQEQHQHAKRKHTADKYVLLHEINRRGNVLGLVIYHAKIEIARLKHRAVQIIDLRTQPFHGFDDIHPGRAQRVDDDGLFAIQAPVARPLCRLQLDRGNIGQQQRHKCSGRRHIGAQDNTAGGLRRVVDSLGPYSIGAFAFGNAADTHHRRRGAQRINHLGQGNPVLGKFCRIDKDPHFLAATPIEGDLGHTIHPAQRFDNLRFQKIAKPFQIDSLARLANQRQPCNRTVIGIRCANLRCSRIRRQPCHRGQLAQKQHQRLVHVLTDAVGQGHRRPATPR